jgi:hypothetical protein
MSCKIKFILSCLIKSIIYIIKSYYFTKLYLFKFLAFYVDDFIYEDPIFPPKMFLLSYSNHVTSLKKLWNSFDFAYMSIWKLPKTSLKSQKGWETGHNNSVRAFPEKQKKMTQNYNEQMEQTIYFCNSMLKNISERVTPPFIVFYVHTIWRHR